MRKGFMTIFLSIVLCISLLIGCGSTEGKNPELDNSQVSDDSEVNVPSDENNENEDIKDEDVSDENSEDNKAPENDKVEDDGAPADSETENTEKHEVPYTTRVKAPFTIFEKAGYDFNIVDTVWEKGLFTIVEEKEDEEGNLWGKLKSGRGWIDLTRVAKEAELPVRAGLIEKNELPKDCVEVILEESEYMVRLAFVANENLKDIKLTSIYLTDDGMADDTLHTLKELKEAQMFVAGVVFTGDFTTFGLEFVDADGETQYYAAYISGRNGELILQEKETIMR